MSSPRWLIGIIMAFVLMTIVSNIVEKADIMTASQVAEIQAMSEHTLSDVKMDTGESFVTASTPLSALEAIWKAISADYSFWYRVDYDTTSAECEEVGGTWLDGERCQTPHPLIIIKYIVFWPISIAMFVELAFILRRIISGS